jgi:hypothetical protein
LSFNEIKLRRIMITMKTIQSLQVMAFAVLFTGATIAHGQTLPSYSVTEGPAGLTTTIPGATISGTQDNWNVTLAGGVVWGSQTTLYLAEPESAAEMNILSFPSANVLNFLSDVTANGKTGLSASVTDTLMAATGAPEGTVTFTDVSDLPSNAPDGGASLGLLGMALAGLLAFQRRLRRC